MSESILEFSSTTSLCNDVHAHIQQDWCQIRMRIRLNADVLVFIQERVIWQLMLLSCTMSCSQVHWSWGAKMLPWKRSQTRPFQKEPQALFSAACPTAPTWPSERCSATGSPTQPLTKRYNVILAGMKRQKTYLSEWRINIFCTPRLGDSQHK